MQRIIGTEVEYGISSPSDPTANPILTSTQAVLAYAAAAGIQRAKRTRWDYEVESPLRDARVAPAFGALRRPAAVAPALRQKLETQRAGNRRGFHQAHRDGIAEPIHLARVGADAALLGAESAQLAHPVHRRRARRADSSPMRKEVSPGLSKS